MSVAMDRSRRNQHDKKDLDLFMIHELRSPLASVKAAATLLLTQEEQLSEEKRTELIKVIESQSVKLLEYINLILDTAKLQSGIFAIQKTPNDIKKVISERVNLYMPLALEKYISLDIFVHDPIPSFYFDPQYIGQVLSNLISNSLKFTPENGRISVTASFNGKDVLVSVADTGYGFSKKDQQRIFAKFYRASNSKSTNGTGLGLYFTKGIIEAHGGTIHIESRVNEGTTVTFTLPFHSRPTQKLKNPFKSPSLINRNIKCPVQ